VLDLGPGTLLTIGGVALAAHLLLHVGLVPSLLLGAVLASTDPIVLRDVLRNPGIPRSMRQLLTLEAGMNDIVVLPVVLVLIAVGQAQISGAAGWVGFLAQLLLLSPLLGLLVGGVGAWLMGQADARYSIRREYQALYGIGLVLAAYAGAQAVGADGFLAAFFGGLAVNLFDVTLCDCFLEYGEVTAEMAMLLTFLLFGAALSTLFGLIAFLPALALAVVVIVIVRPLALSLVLVRARLSAAGRVFLGWFGPRGLSSLLLALLVVEAGTPGAVRLFAVTGVVVLVSTIVHGVSATPGTAWYVRHVARALLTPAEERESTADGLFAHDQDAVPRLTPAELAMQLAGDQPPVVLDVRTRGQYDQDQGQIPNSVRVLPDQLRDWARTADRKRAVVAYCT
jgi:NhaP-type Na+/H+ or K+/H+ antiporter